MSYTPPAGGSVDFKATGVSYVPPAGGAVNFGSGLPLTIEGTSSTSFNAFYDAQFAGTSSASFANSSYGTLERAANIAGTSTVGFKVVAYVDGPISIAGTSTVSAPAKAFGGATLSLIGQPSATSFPTTSFGGGTTTVAGQAAAGFTPIYGLTIAAGASTDMRIGGIVTHPFSAAGSSNILGYTAKVRAGAAAFEGVAYPAILGSRVIQTATTLVGTSVVAAASRQLFGSAAAIAGAASTNVRAGGVSGGRSVIPGIANALPVHASIGTMQLTAAGSSTLLGQFGALVTHPFSSAGAAYSTQWGQTVRQAVSTVAGGVLFATFDSATRVQALRYTTTFLVTDPEPVFVLTAPSEVAVLSEQADVFVDTSRDDVHVATFKTDTVISPVDAKLLYSD